MPSFDALGLDPELLAAVHAQGMSTPTPIQVQAIPVALAGRDLIGQARTGSGKTLAFALPVLQRSTSRTPAALVLTPTRELALQVTSVFRGLVAGCAMPVVGGTPYASQRKALARKPRVVVGTPGRLRDLQTRGDLDLSGVDVVVLDEADEMLRMGFQADLEHLLAATRPDRQVLLFSATMPPATRAVADRILTEPAHLQVEGQDLTVHHIEQRWLRVPAAHKVETLHLLLLDAPEGTALVFANTRVGCVDLADRLGARGLAVERLHGGLDQPLRERVLGRVRRGEVGVLVATDVAARGIDVSHIGLVVNADLPESPERYVHRIGRTARAGRAGLALTLVTPKQKRRLREMASALGVDIAQGEVPTGGAQQRRRRVELQEELAACEAGPHAVALVRRLVEKGRSAEEVAAAAVELLARQRGLELDPAGDDVLPDWVRPVVPRGPEEDVDAVQIVVFAGKEQGVGAAELVAALGARGIPPTRIGRIRLGKRRTQVGLAAGAAEALAASSEELVVGERSVRWSAGSS